MKFFFPSVITMFLALSMLGCGSDDTLNNPENSGSDANTNNRVSSISGVAQKGQFLRGSSVTIYALDKNLNATGLSYPTQTSDDMGSFSVSNVKADYIDVKVNGYYYNENRNATSTSTINLQALAASGSKVNVNILTTLAYNRIKHLVGTGMCFADAQNRAQIEVLTALGFGNSITENFTKMNIADGGDANGLLLAASLLIQQSRSVGDVSKLISDIAADIEDDGLLTSGLNQEIHKYESNIYLESVISGLISFYEKNGVNTYSIPAFYKFLDTDGDGKKDGDSEYLFKALDANYTSVSDEYMYDVNPGYNAGGFTVSQKILSTIPFTVSCDADWISVEKTLITENIYEVKIVAQPNTGENRTAHIIYTSDAGVQLSLSTYQQKAPDNVVPQRLVFPYDQRVETLMSNGVGVNGKTYSVSKTSTGYTMFYVDVPSTDKSDKYQLYFPTDMISMPDGYGSFKLTIPSIISLNQVPYISQLDNTSYNIGNPAAAQFITASPVILTPVIWNVESGTLDNVDHIILSSDYPICGSAMYSISNGTVNMNDIRIIESKTRPNAEGKYTIKVIANQGNSLDDKEIPDYNKVISHGNLTIPVLQYNIPVTAVLYDKNGNIISEYNTVSTDIEGRTR